MKNFNINKTILWITQSAVLIALLVSWQAISKAIPGTLVTGTGVNFILIIATIVCSWKTGLTVAAVSPVMAMLFGVMPPFWILVPFIAMGNIVLVLIWHFIVGIRKHKPLLGGFVILAVITSSAAKFAVLFVGVNVLIAGVMGVNLPPPVLTAFSVSQLFTALGGGVLAGTALALPVLKNEMKGRLR